MLVHQLELSYGPPVMGQTLVALYGYLDPIPQEAALSLGRGTHLYQTADHHGSWPCMQSHGTPGRKETYLDGHTRLGFLHIHANKIKNLIILPNDCFLSPKDQLMHCDTLKQDNDSTVRGDGGSRVGEVRAGTASPMPEHKGFKLQ